MYNVAGVVCVLYCDGGIISVVLVHRCAWVQPWVGREGGKIRAAGSGQLPGCLSLNCFVSSPQGGALQLRCKNYHCLEQAIA